MQNRSRERGAHTSDFTECDSAPGDFSLTAPVDVALWTQSVSGTPFSGSDLFSAGNQEELNTMARNFLHFPKDDEASISSSMDDSAYMSQPDTGRKKSVKDNTSFQLPQDARSQIMEPFQGSNLYSPTLGVDNRGAFHVGQPDMGNMMLPAAAGSDNGESNFRMSDFANFGHGQSVSPTDYNMRAQMPNGQAGWSSAEMPNYSAPFAAGPVEATFAPRHQSYHGRTVSQPIFSSYSSFGIDSMISDSHNMPDQRRARFEQPATAAPADMHRPSLQRAVSDTKARFDSDVLSPSSTVMSTQFSMFPAGSEFGEEPGFVGMVGYAPSGVHGGLRRADFDVRNEHMLATTPPDMIAPNVASDEMGSDDGDYNGNRASEEAEVKLARTHPLYQAAPQADDMYHCPYEGQANCAHKPTKLKCNYDKYVDSHLKPFRCKIASCINVEFSSTACLLRHEREAHGMHGHGSKPHLCAYADCERAIPGNGFPRRYNLYDHMKRVHDYTTPAQSAPGSPRGQAAKRPISRKRKSTNSIDISDKRLKSAVFKQNNTARQRDQEKERLRNEWAERLAIMNQHMRSLTEPKDADSHQQLIDDATALKQVVARLTEMG
ncbi:hypothetical protein IWX50DRAFT_681851 [Phyllosticta citricarpa]